MVNIKFKNLFLIIFIITFFLIIFNFEYRQTKQVAGSSSYVEKIKFLQGFNDDIFNSYANFLLNKRILYNENILNLYKVEINKPTISQFGQIIITFDYSTDDDRNNKLNKIKNEINLINITLKKEMVRYLDNKAEYILLPEQTKIILNYYKNEKDYEFIYLIEKKESKELVKMKKENNTRFIHYLIISILLSFIFSFFFKLYLKNKKNFLTFFDKL